MTFNIRHTALISLVVLSGTLSATAQSSAAGVYVSKCARCHGSDGNANTPMGKMINVPSLTSSSLANATDAALLATITNGSGKMAAYSGTLTDAQITAVVAYIRTLQK